MWVSLNEIESTALKAAHSAGYAWGLAEEAAGAVRWLTMRGLPFLQPLTLGVLKKMQHLESFDSACQIGSSFGPTDRSRRLGPISVLTAFSDERLPLPNGSGEVSVRALAAPVLTLPALARLSRRHDRPLLVRWPGMAVECRNGDIRIESSDPTGLNCLCADWFAVSRLTASLIPLHPAAQVRHHGAELDLTLWQELQALANRNFVPEGETSRLGGASAGASDRD